MFGFMSKLFKSPVTKKGQVALKDMPAIVQVLGYVGIVGAVVLLVLTTLSTSFTGVAAEVIGNITLAIANFFALTPVLGTIFGAVLILGAVALIGYGGYAMYNKVR